MRWWCAAATSGWSWTPKPYLGVWILSIALLVGYFRANAVHLRRHPEDRDGRERRRALWFVLGVAFLWVASDWPVGALGAGYLASVHMLQYMLYTLAVAPLLMLGTPQWMLRAILERTRTLGLYLLAAKPVVAAIGFNAVLIATHAPVTVDNLRATQFGSFALDMIWLLSGFLLWTPVVSPLPEARGRSAASRIVYLFLAAAVVPMIPGGFIAFSPQPLYGTFELAPRVVFDALDDQQLAGVIMKIGNLPVVWTVMAVIWFRWYQSDQETALRRRQARNASRVAAARARQESATTGGTAVRQPVRTASARPATPTGPDLN